LGSRKPLRLWFAAIYLFVVSKQGISAKSLERQIDVSYPTAWTWLHKLRDAVSQRSTLPLRGVVELDDTWEGGLEEGAGGRPKAGNKKALVAGAIEVPPNQKGYGRLRLMHLENGSSAAIQPFIEANIEPGSTLLTDDWRSYRRPASECGLDHQATNVSKSEHKAHHILPAIHRVFSLLHRVLLTTYQGAVRHKHLQRYLEEFEFRFNRRTAGSRGLLFQRALSAATLGKPPPLLADRQTAGSEHVTRMGSLSDVDSPCPAFSWIHAVSVGSLLRHFARSVAAAPSPTTLEDPVPRPASRRTS
jgi:transposase-like protein